MSTQRNQTPRDRGLRVTLVSLIAATSLLACGRDNNADSTSATDAGAGATNSEPPQTAGSTAPTTTERSTTTEVPATTAAPDPCEPIGTLTTFELNDRCVGATSDDFGEEFAGALRALDYWVDDQSCPNGELVVAKPNEVLVTATDPGQLDAAVQQVISRLPVGSTTSDDFKTNLAQVIEVPGSVDVADVLKALPTLQGEGWSADLNYLEPLQPNWAFRPADDPHTPTTGVPVPDTVAVNGDTSVLILDSTDDTSLYDVDGNEMVDEDHGHGAFVKSIIERRAPQAIVTLQEVTTSAQRLPSGRWVPMMFSDLDLVRAMEPHFGSGEGPSYVIDTSFDVVNLSLGGSGCTMSGFGYGVGERLALARALDAFSQFDPAMRFVAAAGNNHGWAEKIEFKHFPAAWRDQSATEALATAVDGDPNGGPAVGTEVRDIHARLTAAMIAVGAGDGLTYTNCGPWINAVQPGTEIGTYPAAASGEAQWSGTSFATANESALVASGQVPTDTLPCPP